MRALLAISISLCVSQPCWGEETFAENLDTVTRLEAAGKWEEALPIYQRSYEKNRLALDGLTVRFMLRKGICELQCKRFKEAEQSFAWVIDGSEAKHEELDKVRAMFYLSETLARENKPDLSRKALDDANRFLAEVDGLPPGWIEWSKKLTERINNLAEDPDFRE